MTPRTPALPACPPRPALLAAMIAAALAGAGCGTTADEHLNVRPTWLGTVTAQAYDGTTDDLLTAGLGRTGLAAATAPAFAAPATPTAAELRRLAIWNNYRALADMTANGGYGRLYGPNIDLAGQDTLGEGRIAGTEHRAFIDDGSGRDNIGVMVQVPSSFNPAAPCIVAAPSSGSRGIYGAIGTTGEWGLKRGCAVAYTDKGTGNGAHELDSDTVTRLDGSTATAAAAGTASHFTAGLTAAERAAFITAKPFRYAFKHAHSQRNPEKDWGLWTLRAIETAFWVLNETHGETSASGARKVRFRADNTLVIAASVSNGGGAVLAAAEQDTDGLIDGIVATEPQVSLPASAGGVAVRRGGAAVSAFGKPLYDYFTVANLYQPCAAIAASNAGSPFNLVNATRAANRCASLKAAGLLAAATTADQAEEAKAKLRQAGWEAETDLLHASHWASNATAGVAVTYANAYGRAAVNAGVCGYSFATVAAATGLPAAPAASPMTTIFSAGNGVPPTSTVALVADLAPGGAINYLLAKSASSGTEDLDFDGAKCLRDKLTDAQLAAGIDAVRRTGRLQGKPTLIVHGRSDTLVPVNHSSRPYYGLSRLADGGSSRLSYIEVTNAQHFDAFIGSSFFAGYDTRFVPLHHYNLQALNLMWAHLNSGAALPPSQVVRTTPRGGTPGAAPAITAANLPAISASPAAADQIGYDAGTVSIPD